MSTPKYPPVEIKRKWTQAGRGEEVPGRNNAVWVIQDLQRAVEGTPVYDVPLIFLDLGDHAFDTSEGLIGFAIHMKHVLEADLKIPIILDEWGSILDGRHRLVKALVEGHTTIKMQRVPKGTAATFRRPS